ncbi:lipopolysaccharide biosynthesis protein [Lactococcus lactis subsp. lactis]|uniref:lipopolysaccharide biosynthesis protein n=1 Tax=Lactococcus lactis TaxID=1358 RepID=UPI002A818053|nr:lipopolysaccharide biosynthesis protein [Lactococcus lactis]MDY4363489.1 lipopolysaccharide biosynthesis protein [Lactococcus lactis subsp. lactis]
MNKSLKQGLLFTALGTYSNFALQILIQMVLSRLLTPYDYGTVAIMSVFILFFQIMIEAGLGPAIIQNKELTMENNYVLFNFSVIFSILIACLFGLFGIVLSKIYNNPIYIYLTWLQAISVFFNGLNIVPTALLNKEKLFKKVNFSLVISNFFSAVVGLSVAFNGGGIYALILSTITTSVINFILNRFFTKVTFNFNFDLSQLKKVWKFAKNQFAFNFINYFSRNADNILVGKFMGTSDLANYNKAYQLLMLPNTLFINVVNPVLQPVLSDYQDNPEYIRGVYYNIIHVLMLIGIPLSVFLSSTSKQIIFSMFGSQWSSAIFPFSVLSMTVWSQLAVTPVGAVFQARNQSDKLFVTGIFTGTGLISSIIIGIYFGTINSVAICLTVGFIYSFIINYYRLIKYSLGGKFSIFAKQFYSPVVLGCITFAVLKIEGYTDPNNLLLSLIFRGIIFCFCWGCFVWFTPEKKIVIKFIKRGDINE